MSEQNALVDPKALFKENTGDIFHVVGTVSFNNLNSAVVLGTKIDGSLTVRDVSPPDVDPAKLAIAPGRCLDLRDYAQIQFVKLGLGSIEISPVYSATKKTADYVAALRYTHPDTPEKRTTINLDEQELLTAVIGESGGLAIFDDNLKPNDDYALVVEQKDKAGTKTALIGVFIPSELRGFTSDSTSFFSAASATGAQEFFTSLNKQLLENAEIPPDVKAAINVLGEKEIQKRTGENPFRLEILKTQLIASARLYTLTGNSRYQEYLQKLISIIKPRTIWPKKPTPATSLLSAEIDRTIERLIRNHNPERKKVFDSPVAPSVEKNPLGLTTRGGMRLYNFYHGQLGKNFGLSQENIVRDQMMRYVIDIIQFGQMGIEDEDADMIYDAVKLFNEISKTDFNNYIIHKSPLSKFCDKKWGNFPTVGQLIFKYVQQFEMVGFDLKRQQETELY